MSMSRMSVYRNASPEQTIYHHHQERATDWSVAVSIKCDMHTYTVNLMTNKTMNKELKTTDIDADRDTHRQTDRQTDREAHHDGRQ